MKIGIDIDDTICRTWKYVKPYFKKRFKVDTKTLRENSYSRSLNITREEYYEFFKKEISPLIPYVPIKRDAKKYINKLKEEHEIYFITSRSTLDIINPYDVTKEYLDKNNIKYTELLVNSLKKDEVCLKYNIDLFIDDSGKHCASVSKQGIPVLLINASYNKKLKGFKRVFNWKEIYNIVERKAYGRKNSNK